VNICVKYGNHNTSRLVTACLRLMKALVALVVHWKASFFSRGMLGEPQ